MDFAKHKAAKLKRITGLRIMHYLGMVAWRPCEYDGAKQYLRLIHPLTVVWLVGMTLYGILSQGIPDTVQDIGHSLKHDTVWF
jgi:hypothetical protein